MNFAISLFIFFLTVPSQAATAQRNFVQICEDDELPWEQLITIMRIMNDLTAHDCSVAAVMVESNQSLVLPSGGQPISHLDPIQGFTELETLSVPGNKIGELRPLKRLLRLRVLGLRMNRVADLSPLLALKHLVELDIAFNPARSFEVLDRMPALKDLWLDVQQAAHLSKEPHNFRIHIVNPPQMKD